MIIIIISLPPELTTYPINQTKIEGEKVTFTCDATGNPEHIFLWSKDGAAVNTTLRIGFSSDIKQLFITNVNREQTAENTSVELLTILETISPILLHLTHIIVLNSSNIQKIRH
ncbi:unnamed protein product [Porites evermanni]|uniref:Ig-like domain-containing protein n=1 Tax=Porites evermanni TaxID=104178 RepID=A0ABN8MR54_9CNID|nr:unnamed protein product [Porites evermanni]